MKRQFNGIKRFVAALLIAVAPFGTAASGNSEETVRNAEVKNGNATAAALLTPAASIPNATPPVKQAVGSTTRRKYTDTEIADKLKNSTCYIRFVKGKSAGSGTGWVVDAKNGLIVTNQHVIDHKGPADKLLVIFPVRRQGNWETDWNWYSRNAKLRVATVIACSKQRDLALLKVKDVPANVVALKLASRSPVAASRLHSIGGKPRGTTRMWTYTFGKVRGVGDRKTALGLKCRMVECQMPINKGNSGGPIVNDYLELVAVVEGGEVDPMVKDVTFHVDVQEVRHFLKKAVPMASPKTADVFYHRGLGHQAAGRTSQAQSDFTSAIRLRPKFANAFAARARTYVKKRDYHTAIADTERALKIDFDNAAALHARGLARRGLKNYDAAIADFAGAISADPKNAEHYFARGVTQFLKGKREDAYQDYVQATQLDATQFSYWSHRAYAGRLTGHYKDAVKAYLKAFSMDPQDYLLNGLGIAQFHLKEYKKALGAFKLAIKFRELRKLKQSQVQYGNVGHAYLMLGDLNKAYGYFSAALKLDPKYGFALYYRGIVLKKAGRIADAKKDFAKAAEYDAKNYKGRVANQLSEIKMIGKWSTRVNLNGRFTQIEWAFAPNGQFEKRTTVYDRSGRPDATKETGTYQVIGSKVVLSANGGATTRRHMSTKSGSLWLYRQADSDWTRFYRQR